MLVRSAVTLQTSCNTTYNTSRHSEIFQTDSFMPAEVIGISDLFLPMLICCELELALASQGQYADSGEKRSGALLSLSTT